MEDVIDMDHQDTYSRRERSALKEYFIDAGTILRYLIGTDERLDTVIICNPHKQRFVTTDQEVYHALGAVKAYDDFKLKKLSKLFETVTIKPVARKQLLTDRMVEKLRAEALKTD